MRVYDKYYIYLSKDILRRFYVKSGDKQDPKRVNNILRWSKLIQRGKMYGEEEFDLNIEE